MPEGFWHAHNCYCILLGDLQCVIPVSCSCKYYGRVWAAHSCMLLVLTPRLLPNTRTACKKVPLTQPGGAVQGASIASEQPLASVLQQQS